MYKVKLHDGLVDEEVSVEEEVVDAADVVEQEGGNHRIRQLRNAEELGNDLRE